MAAPMSEWIDVMWEPAPLLKKGDFRNVATVLLSKGRFDMLCGNCQQGNPPIKKYTVKYSKSKLKDGLITRTCSCDCTDTQLLFCSTGRVMIRKRKAQSSVDPVASQLCLPQLLPLYQVGNTTTNAHANSTIPTRVFNNPPVVVVPVPPPGAVTGGGTTPNYEELLYSEDLAWEDNARFEEKKLPFPPSLPSFPDDPSQTCETSCIWNFDENNRVLRVQLRPDTAAYLPSDKKLLYLMMERDDVSVITQGHCSALDMHKFAPECLTKKVGDRMYHNIKHFKQKLGSEHLQYCETQVNASMLLSDYFEYLSRREFLMKPEGQEKSGCATFFCNEEKDESGTVSSKSFYLSARSLENEVECNLLEHVLYLLDFSIEHYLPSQLEALKEEFHLAECLPGGKMCMLRWVRNTFQPTDIFPFQFSNSTLAKHNR
jgi:hypothetical protein